MSHNSKTGGKKMNRRKLWIQIPQRNSLLKILSRTDIFLTWSEKERLHTVCYPGTNSFIPTKALSSPIHLGAQPLIQSATSTNKHGILTDLSHPLPRNKRSFPIRKPTLQSSLVHLPGCHHHGPHKAAYQTRQPTNTSLHSPIHNSGLTLKPR